MHNPRRFLSHFILSCLLMMAPPVLALPGSSFEGDDGDLVPGTGTDWETFNGSPELTIGLDEPSGQTDDSLKGKEDDPAPGIVVGSIPNNKSDLLRFYVVHETVEIAGVPKDILNLAWVRDNTLGTANMDFEFNQSGLLSVNGVTPERTAGDMLITYEFSSGGSVINIGLSRWTETGTCEASSSTPCWGPIMPLNGIADAAVNTVEVFDPVSGVTLPAMTFGEASINLTDAGVFGHDECVSFGSAYVKSRSSDSFTASMKDFIKPIDVSVSNCVVLTIVKDAVPDSVTDFTFLPSPNVGPASFDLDDDGDEDNGLASRMTFPDLFPDTYTVAEEPAPGWDLTDVSCTDGGIPLMDDGGSYTGEVVIEGEAGDRVECTYTNTSRGMIVIDQATIPAGDPQVFQFTLTGGPGALNESFGLDDAAPPYRTGTVRPGTYSAVQQDAGPGWDLTSVVCDDGSPADAIVLDPGETVTCTFTNTKRGRIVTDKVAYPAGDPQMFEFTLSGGPDGINDIFGLADLSDVRSSTFLRHGT
jgi:hypothetical protein